MMIHDVIVVGAGIAGLSLAREIRARGLAPLVLERAGGVGGRCATRRIDGQPVDHGLAFLHGRTSRFLDEFDGVRDATGIPDWPRVREGAGTPCQPVAFDAASHRLAFVEGVSRFAKHLARTLDVRLEAGVTALQLVEWPEPPAGRCWELALASGERLRASAVALTMPAPAAVALLQRMEPPSAEVAALLPLLQLVRMLPCLTVIARYPAAVTVPRWEACLPGDSAAIQTILHDSSKRPAGARPTLVIQARPGFSLAHLGDPVESWTQALLDEAAALQGDWLAGPESVQSHIWRNARVAAGSELAHPVVATADGGALLGIAGDGLHDAGGVEGAYLSGFELAARFLELLPDRT
jgi:renalase